MSNRLRAGKKGSSTAGLAEEAIREICRRVVGIYVFLMFAVFPLFLTDYYYNILKDKLYFFLYSTLLAGVVCAVVSLLGLLGKKSRKGRSEAGPKPFFQRAFDKMKAFRQKLSLTDRFFIAFLLVAALSTVFSEWPYQAFWGNMGRYQGLLFYLTVGVSYWMITRCYAFRKSHLYALLIAGALVSLWGITDFFGLDVFHFREIMGGGTDLLVFSSSIGNINTLTGLLALYLGVAAVLCIGSGKWYLVFPALFIFLSGLVTGLSDNAVLSVACVYALTPFFAFRTKKGFIRYLYMAAVLFLACGVMGVLAVKDTVTTTSASYSWMVGVLMKISMEHGRILLIASAVLFVTAFGLGKAWQSRKEESAGPARGIWAALCLLGLAGITVVVVMANTGRLPEALRAYEGLLVFGDSWGTNRGYAWKHLFAFFKKFPFAKKLIGSGPETYSIFMAKNLYYDMQEKIGQVFDSPHSEPLQFLFTMGILGFVSYYGSVIAACVRGMKQNGPARVFAFAVVAATAASLVNISVPITTPLVFLSLAIAGSVKDSEENS